MNMYSIKCLSLFFSTSVTKYWFTHFFHPFL
jgi:hypothetical protein